ncbi:hypothetical protein KR074_008044 [Drosophila pseudoananassae]|nr:hypothetical protein KR074_008044 [Drosophila pseudoananassae]
MRQRNLGNNNALKRHRQQQQIDRNCCLSKRCNYDNIWQHFNRNATLEEIRYAAARICRDHLNGRWKTVAPEDLIVKRISGGLSNFLYYISLPEFNEYEEEEEEQLQKRQQIEENVNGKVVTATGTKNSPVYARDDVVETKSVGVMAGATKLALTDDDDDTAVSEKQAPKRQRFDSDSVASTYLKRMQPPKQEPREVLLRIYGQTHGDNGMENMITESVVFALLSERNFGPKLYGIFPGGRIEQFLPARSLATAELGEQRISLKIAEKLGDIHSLTIPMSKEPDWIWTCMHRWVSSFDGILKGKCLSKSKSSPVLKKQMELLRTIDYVEEIAWLKSVIESGDYPVVFCHNDLQEGNILMRQTQQERTPRVSISSLRSTFDETLGDSLDGNSNSNISEPEQNKVHSVSPPPCPELDTTDDSALDSSFTIDSEPDLIIIDFEYCAYNYRGYDLANHFIEWTFDYTNPQYPYFHHNKSNYATGQQRRDFIVQYLKSYHDDENYSPKVQELEKVDEEIRFFTMLSHLFWSLWSIINLTSAIEFGYWEYGIARIVEYQKLKSDYLSK